MKTTLKLIGLFALLPTISFAELADFGARSQPVDPNGFAIIECHGVLE